MLHYEIHVTVQTNCTERFKARCKELGVKPIILDLQKKSGDVLCEVMTSSTLSTYDKTVNEAKAEMLRISMGLAVDKEHFTVIRAKIETVPWHPMAPSEHNGKFHFEGSHYETHFGVIIKSQEDVLALCMFAESHKLHLSKNAIKRFDDGSFVQMATFRSYTALKEDFELIVDSITRGIYGLGLTLEKTPKIEFAIYDTNADHDAEWLSGEKFEKAVYKLEKFDL